MVDKMRQFSKTKQHVHIYKDMHVKKKIIHKTKNNKDMAQYMTQNMGDKDILNQNYSY